MNNIQEQRPYSVKQVNNPKPNVPRSSSVLSGYIANSMNGGHNKVIAYKQVMAGERHKEYRLKANFRMLTPLTPTYQNLKMTIRAYFVPNSRVWDNAEKFTAQRGGTTEVKIAEIPNTRGKELPVVNSTSGSNNTNIVNTDMWRDSYISSYIPRMGQFTQTRANTGVITMPAISILPLRGRIAIYNDMERNKEYDAELMEYKDDTVSNEEWESYLPTNPAYTDIYFMRSRKQNSYYTDYRTEIQGFESTIPPDIVGWADDNSLITWAAWESKISEARSEAENAQANDWDIIAKIRGSKILTEGKVQKIGQKTFNLNYAAITQNAYNSDTELNDQFRVLGQQGAYSYTEVNVPLYAGMEFKEEGYIHIIATVDADTVFESAIDRLELNVGALDGYRPDLKDDKYDVLYDIELGTTKSKSQLEANYATIKGYKRRFSEYFKLPNIIGGDMTTKNYIQTLFEGNVIKYAGAGTSVTQIETNKTFQFFEEDDEYFYDRIHFANTKVYPKKSWLSYADLMINKNQAIMNEVSFTEQESTAEEGEVIYYNNCRILGQNQIFFVGVCSVIADLPIDESIKENYTTWGEH